MVESLREKIREQAKPLKVHKQHDGWMWIEQEDLEKLVPNMESDSTLKLELVSVDVVSGLLDKAIEQIREKLNQIFIASTVGAVMEILDSRNDWRKGYKYGFSDAIRKINEDVLSVLGAEGETTTC